jgi:hypothetical protein
LVDRTVGIGTGLAIRHEWRCGEAVGMMSDRDEDPPGARYVETFAIDIEELRGVVLRENFIDQAGIACVEG